LSTTMHSGSPAGALLRLLDMGMEPYQITSSVWGVLNQRLIRRLCDVCKKPQRDGTALAQGCDACLHTGFKGRVLVAEMVNMDSVLRTAILEKADRDEIETLLGVRGHETLLCHGERLIGAGLTSREELNRTFGIG